MESTLRASHWLSKFVPDEFVQHPSKMLTYYLYAPLFDEHCALSTNPSPALYV
jgi:hypothetical protein